MSASRFISHHADHDQHADGEHHREIARFDRGDEQPARAGHREDRLGHHGTAGELADRDADEGDHRQDGVRRRMTERHAPLAQSLGMGHADELALDDVLAYSARYTIENAPK